MAYFFLLKITYHTLTRRRISILLVECDPHNGKSLFVPLAKLGFPINYEFRIKSIDMVAMEMFTKYTAHIDKLLWRASPRIQHT